MVTGQRGHGWAEERGLEGWRSFRMERMVCGAQVHPMCDKGEDTEGAVRWGPWKAIGASASAGERWGDRETPPI